jgi:hypothetical protein
MNYIEKDFWLAIEQKINALLKAHRGALSEESIEAVQHYLDHSEYEIALEGLIIELMKNGINYEDTWSQLALELDLDKETVLLPDSWKRMVIYREKQ